jgi:enolase
LYDGGKAWGGKGMLTSVRALNEMAASRLLGMDARNQTLCDEIILAIGRHALGACGTTALSCAVLKAGAASNRLPLYAHLGGVRGFTLPVPVFLGASGSTRYGKQTNAGYQPSYYFVAYDYSTYEDAAFALWETVMNWEEMIRVKLGVKAAHNAGIAIPAGTVKDDCQLWDMMAENIVRSGAEGRIGLYADLSAQSFYNETTGKYEGLISSIPKDREDILCIAQKMAKDYPFVVLEDPLRDDDVEGYAYLTRSLDIQIVGDDLFAGRLERVRQGVFMEAANAVRLSVPQAGTVTEAAILAQYAYENGYGLLAGSERGEGLDACDFAVAFNCGISQQMGLCFAGNRFLQIAEELGSRARFMGCRGISGSRFQLRSGKGGGA